MPAFVRTGGRRGKSLGTVSRIPKPRAGAEGSGRARGKTSLEELGGSYLD